MKKSVVLFISLVFSGLIYSQNVVKVILPEPCVATFGNVSGTVTYSNTKNSLLSGVIVSLYNSENTKIDSYTTGSDGSYIFNNIPTGVYKLEASSTKSWGGVNPVDALSINRSYLGTYTFKSSLAEAAANVNGDKSINPVDALLVNKRYIGTIDFFAKVPDWLFDTSFITVNTSAVIQNIKGICAGDVNGDFDPNAKK